MKLVENWKQAWRWFSVQALAALIAFPAVWVALPADIKSRIPDDWMFVAVMLVAVGGVIGRVIDQNKGKAT